MKVKTSVLIGPTLDWAVAKCRGYVKRGAVKVYAKHVYIHNTNGTAQVFSPSTDWSQGGPIIEREKIGTWPPDDTHQHWTAGKVGVMQVYNVPSPLIAAMRCFVASKLGDEVEVPEELCE